MCKQVNSLSTNCCAHEMPASLPSDRNVITGRQWISQALHTWDYHKATFLKVWACGKWDHVQGFIPVNRWLDPRLEDRKLSLNSSYVSWNFLWFLSQTFCVCVCVVLEPSQLQVASARIVVMGGFFFQAHASSFVSFCRVLASTEPHGTKFPVHQHVLQRGTILVWTCNLWVPADVC